MTKGPFVVSSSLGGLNTDVCDAEGNTIACCIEEVDARMIVNALNRRQSLQRLLKKYIHHLRKFKNTKKWHEERKRLTGI